MGPRNAYKDMLDNVVSPITCISMNHQNQLEQMANGAMFATVSTSSPLASEKIATVERKKLGEIIPLQRRHFLIVGAARKPKPQWSHAPPAKRNFTAEYRRRANPGPRWTRLELNLLKDGTRSPCHQLGGRGRGRMGAKGERWRLREHAAAAVPLESP
jgi:hypothetical protein